VISYAAVTGSPEHSSITATTVTAHTKQVSSQAPSQQVTNVSSLTDHDLDQLYERLKHHVALGDDASPGISAEDMERMVKESNNSIQQVRDEMSTSVTTLTEEITKIGEQVKRQNVVVVGVQKSLEATSKDLKDSVNRQVSKLSNHIQGLRNLVL